MDTLHVPNTTRTIQSIAAEVAQLAARFPSREHLPDRRSSGIPLADGSGNFDIIVREWCTDINTWQLNGGGHRRYAFSSSMMTDSQTPGSYLRPEAAEALLELVTRSIDGYRSPLQIRKDYQTALPVPEFPTERELRTHAGFSKYARAMIDKYGQEGDTTVSVMENENYKLILSVNSATGIVTLRDELFNKEEYTSALQIVVGEGDSIVMYSMLPNVGGETAWRYLSANLKRFHATVTK